MSPQGGQGQAVASGKRVWRNHATAFSVPGDKCKQCLEMHKTGRWVEKDIGGLGDLIQTSGGGLPTDKRVTVSAAPGRSGPEVFICIYNRDQLEGESEDEEQEPGGPGGRDHNTARSTGNGACDIGGRVAACVGLGGRVLQRARGGEKGA